MSNNYNFKDVVLKHNYYIDVKHEDNYISFKFPLNMFLKHVEITYKYYLNDEDIVLEYNNSKYKIKCPKYSHSSVVFVDLLIKMSTRNLTVDFLFKDKEKFIMKELTINDNREEKLVRAVYSLLDGNPINVDKDIEDGYKAVMSVIENVGIE